jgi:pyruvate kinase
MNTADAKHKDVGIISTLGPSTDTNDMMHRLIQFGVNIFRINMSHGNQEEYLDKINKIKKLQNKGLKVEILLDTKGPEIRTKTFKTGKVLLKKGSNFILTTDEVEGDQNIVTITYKDLPKQVKRKQRIFVDDGLIELIVKKVEGNNIHTLVRNEGVLENNKSINLPDMPNNMVYISEKDRSDLIFACNNKVQYIAASFIRTRQDVLDIKNILHEHGCDNIKIISKIENQQGIDNIDEIIEVSEMIMVARGDMGVEIPFAKVPKVQRMIVEKCNKADKKVIVATQMLESMTTNPRPTRAEVSDVYNAVLDGADFVMLSGETAKGKYPVKAVQTMYSIIKEALL